MTEQSLKHIEYEVRNGVAYVTLCRKGTDEDRPLYNPLSDEMMEEITRVFQSIKANPNVTQVLLKAGDDYKHFSAGMDLKDMKEVIDNAVGAFTYDSSNDSYTVNREKDGMNIARAEIFARMLDEVATCEKPIVTLVKGASVGAGATLVMLSDYVIATENAQYGYPERTLAQNPEVSGPYVVGRVGCDNAAYLFIKNRNYIGNGDAIKLGIVQKVVSTEQEMKEAAEEVLAKGLQKRQWTAVQSIKPTNAIYALAENKKYIQRLVEDMEFLFKDRTPEGRKNLIATTSLFLAEGRSTPEAKLALDNIRSKHPPKQGGQARG